MAKQYSLYFASPFFRPDQIEREERLKAHLRSLGFKVFSPKEESLVSSIADIESQEKAFQMNLNGIKDTDAVFAVTDGKDMGTIWEAGYAFGVGKPIIYYAETLGNGQFNLMLARSGNVVYQSQGAISADEIIAAIETAATIDYQGEIE